MSNEAERKLLATIHNDSAAKAARQIINPTLAAGGSESAVTVTLESVVTIVLLRLTRGDARLAAQMLEEGLTPGVLERLADYGARGGRVK